MIEGNGQDGQLIKTKFKPTEISTGRVQLVGCMLRNEVQQGIEWSHTQSNIPFNRKEGSVNV